MGDIDKISSAMRSAKFALIQAKKAIARNLDTGGEDEWAQCDYAIREIDVIDMGGDFDTLRSDLARVTAERDALKARLDDYYDDHRVVVAGQCAPDEKHCSCVPHLRREVEAMRGVETCLREAIRIHAGFGDNMAGPLMRGTKMLRDLDALRARKVGG